MAKKLPLQPSKTFLINLESRNDRLQGTIKEFEKVWIKDYQVFKAINWKALWLFYTWWTWDRFITRDKYNTIIDENMIPAMRTPYRKARMAWMTWCFLSHYLIFQEAYHNKYESILVFEDDVWFIDVYNDSLASAMKHISKDREFILLWWNHEPRNSLQFVNEYFSIPNKVWGSHAYYVNKSWIEKIYKMFNERWMVDHVDIMMFHCPLLHIYCLTEPLCVQRSSTSDIW